MKDDTITISSIGAETTVNQLCEIVDIDRFCGTSAGTEIISIYAPAFEFCYDEVKEKSNVEDKFRCK